MEPTERREPQSPRYPTLAEHLARRACGQVPDDGSSRLSRRIAAALAMLVAAGAASCSEPHSDSQALRYRPAGTSADRRSSVTAASTDDRGGLELARTIVAPVFQFGEGLGATGCMVVSPPAFLSEEEALMVIKAQLALHGIKLGAPTVLGEVSVPRRHYVALDSDDFDSFSREHRRIVVDEDAAQPLEVDAVDDAGRIAVEFIGLDDYEQLGGLADDEIRLVDEEGTPTGSMIGSSVSTFDFKDTASFVAGRIESEGWAPLHVGVFYDPMADPWSLGDSFERYADSEEGEERDWEAAWATEQTELRRASHALLRRQVEAFVGWLHSEGVL